MPTKQSLRKCGAWTMVVCVAFAAGLYFTTGFVAYAVLGLATAILVLVAVRPAALTFTLQMWERLIRQDSETP